MDNILGAIALGSLSLMAGQVPPLTALPEEVAVVPAGTIIGGIVGFDRIKKFFSNFF